MVEPSKQKPKELRSPPARPIVWEVRYIGTQTHADAHNQVLQHLLSERSVESTPRYAIPGVFRTWFEARQTAAVLIGVSPEELEVKEWEAGSEPLTDVLNAITLKQAVAKRKLQIKRKNTK